MITYVELFFVVLITFMWYNLSMEELFKEYKTEVTVKQAEKFEKYCDLIIEYNNKFNITAITERREIYVKHFVDSLLGAGMLISGKLLDVGSGGGLPAIPIAIVRDDIDVNMLEATGKKCEFLNVVIKELGLKNAKVFNGRAEEFAFNKSFREKFDMCTARAVARLNVLCEYTLPFVKKGGFLLAYKGDAEEELKEAENAVKTLGGAVKEDFKTELDGAKRELIKIEKVAYTDDKYPRANGRIRKSPL